MKKGNEAEMHNEVKVLNPYHMAVQQFELAADRLNLSEDMREILRQPKRELTVNFPVRLDSGRIKTFTGYRVQHNVNRGPAKGGIRWGLTLKGDDTIIGTAGFPGIDDKTYRARIGYNLASAHWGRGLATEAVRALVGFGFAQLNLNRIEATTNLDNTGSMRVLAKVGFTEEGILRDYVYWREVGAFSDARMYSLLRREYAG